MRKSKSQLTLIGCDPGLIARVKDEIEGLDAGFEAEFPDVRTAISSLILSSNETRVFIVHVTSPDDLPSLKRLGETPSGAIPSWR